MTDNQLLSPLTWRRASRGISCDIPGATSADIAKAVAGLPREWAPYKLLLLRSVKQGKLYTQQVVEAEYAEMDELVAGGEWSYFLWSPVLTPKLEFHFQGGFPDGRAGQYLSVNGLIVIHYARLIGRQPWPTSIGCVPLVESDAGVRREHVEYRTVCQSLIRRIRRIVKQRGTTCIPAEPE